MSKLLTALLISFAGIYLLVIRSRVVSTQRCFGFVANCFFVARRFLIYSLDVVFALVITSVIIIISLLAVFSSARLAGD